MEKDNDLDEKTEELTDLINGISRDEIPDIPKETENDFDNIVKKHDYKGLKNDFDVPQKSRKRKLKKWVYVVIIILILGLGAGIYKIINSKKVAQKEETINSIREHYNEFVKVDKDTDLYLLENDKYQVIGKVYENANLELDKIDITENTKYFKVKDLDYYILYSDVTKSSKEESDERYKEYIPFNISIITKDSFTMYKGDEKILTLNKEMKFPVIINNYDGKYYVEYNNMLVSISKDDVSETVDSKNTDKKNQSKITTLAYHRVYDTDEKCTDPYVCFKKESFDKQMKYLSDNNYLTLTMDEMYMYMKGYLQIEKGVVITFDDGYLFKSADEVLDRYNLNGTMFVISGDFKDYSEFQNLKAIDIQSHTHNMHRNYVCSGGNQGGAILCAGKEKIVNDLKTSIEALKVKPIALAYPFYDYNETAISALKEVGFKMGFVGRAGVMGRATPKLTDLYKIPRMTVWEESLMSFNSWKGYL